VNQSYLALGDSYTIGEGAGEHERWPVQLAARLRNLGLPVHDPRIIAKTGWTTDELLSEIEHADLAGNWDLVSLLAGVNDQYRGYGLERYRDSFTTLFQRALGFTKLPGRLIVLSIPDWGVTPFAEGRDRDAIAREIEGFNEAARRIAQEAGARFVDITPSSRLAATDPGMLVSDGLHPSGAMYRAWADLVLPVAARALSPS
jgi:lysophospholipase L1-like esterase